MFGYVKPYKPDLRMREFDLYQAVYCGLCKQLGQLFGPLARLTLSYDFTFLAVVSLAAAPGCAGFKRGRCAANPLKKKNCLSPCDDLSFAASAAMILFYYKVRDNIQDEGFIKRLGSRLILPYAGRVRKKAARLYPELDKIACSIMEEQDKVEHSTDTSTDRAADPTAKALGRIFELLKKQHAGGHADEAQSRVLYRMGYQLGRWIYFMDALDDLKQDVSRGGYNPFARRLSVSTWSKEEQLRVNQYATEILNLSVTELASAYELLDTKRYQEILNNVIYLGLKQTQSQLMEQSLLTKKEKKALRRARQEDPPQPAQDAE